MAKRSNRDIDTKRAKQQARSARTPARNATAYRESTTEVPDLGLRPTTPDALHKWLAMHLKIRVPRTPLIEGNCAPFDYLQFAFFGDTCHRLPKAVGADITPDLSESSSKGPGCEQLTPHDSAVPCLPTLPWHWPK